MPNYNNRIMRTYSEWKLIHVFKNSRQTGYLSSRKILLPIGYYNRLDCLDLSNTDIHAEQMSNSLAMIILHNYRKNCETFGILYDEKPIVDVPLILDINFHYIFLL